MKVTEHNITDWNLSENELNDLIRLVKSEMKKEDHDLRTQTYYGIILGKLIIMKNSEND